MWSSGGRCVYATLQSRRIERLQGEETGGAARRKQLPCASGRRYRAVVIGSEQPLLFLDVDGPLIPFGATREQLPDGYPTYESGHTPREPDANPLIPRINPAHGPRLLALPCDLVWATTWMSDANDCIAPWLGLPELPLVSWPESAGSAGSADEDARYGLHWKTRPLLGWAAGRPFAWVDDEITDTDEAWVEAHHSGPALLCRVDPRRGITDEDYATLGSWLRTRRGAGARRAPRPRR